MEEGIKVKVLITKDSGSNEELALLSAFKESGNSYIVFESGKNGSMGLPIIYISKLEDNKLKKVNNPEEWQSVKNYLKGIINGTNFEYIKIPNNLTSEEDFYTPLTLPQASFDLIKSRYVVNEAPAEVPLTPNPEVAQSPVTPIANPEIPTSTVPQTPPAPTPNPVMPEAPVGPQNGSSPVAPSLFTNEKETFMKACENMFDALVSKYEKRLNDLGQKEAALNQREQEIAQKLQNANETLANAQAREQVANIAHDNAQRVMNDMTPISPTPSPAVQPAPVTPQVPITPAPEVSAPIS